jgi:acetoin utilization deacetylase AcuC-like enzyme
MNLIPAIRGITRATVEQDTTTGLYVIDAAIVVRADSASAALAQLEQAIAAAQKPSEPECICGAAGPEHHHRECPARVMGLA